MNNTPPIPPREGLNLKNVMPPVPHEVLQTPASVETNQIPEQTVQTAPQPEIVSQGQVPAPVVKEDSNHDMPASSPGLVFAQGPQDIKEVVERGTDSKLNNISEAESLVNTINQIQNEQPEVK